MPQTDLPAKKSPSMKCSGWPLRLKGWMKEAVMGKRERMARPEPMQPLLGVSEERERGASQA